MFFHFERELLNPFSGATNSLVNVTFNLALSTVFCKFLDQQDSTVKSCIIEYGPSRSCGDLLHKQQNNASTISTVAIDLRDQPQLFEEIMHCFVVTASSKTFTLKVKGSFNTCKYTYIACIIILY